MKSSETQSVKSESSNMSKECGCQGSSSSASEKSASGSAQKSSASK